VTADAAADHITVLDAALAQLPEPDRARVVVLVRADTGAGSGRSCTTSPTWPAVLGRVRCPPAGARCPHGLAADLLTWTQRLALTGTPARTWELKRLRLRLLAVAGRIVRTGRQHLVRLPRGLPRTGLITTGHHRLHVLRSDPADQPTGPRTARQRGRTSTAPTRALHRSPRGPDTTKITKDRG
jgi:hypothetical protein